MGAVCNWRGWRRRAVGAHLNHNTTKVLRGFFELRHLRLYEDDEELTKTLARLASWAERQRAPDAKHDIALIGKDHKLRESWMMGLLMHLATINPAFFHLSKIILARALIHSDEIDAIRRRVAALLLLAEEPARNKPKLARNVLIILGVAHLRMRGFDPLENESSRKPKGRSGCSIFANEMRRLGEPLSDSAIAKIWERRRTHLISAGFTEEQAYELLEKHVV